MNFYKMPFLTGIMIGIHCSIIRCIYCRRRLSLIADALSHVTLAGIAASLLIEKNFAIMAGLNPLYLGMVFSVGGSLFIEKLRGVYKHYQELGDSNYFIKWNWAWESFLFHLQMALIPIYLVIYLVVCPP